MQIIIPVLLSTSRLGELTDLNISSTFISLHILLGKYQQKMNQIVACGKMNHCRRSI